MTNNIKTIKFTQPLSNLILDGKKHTTWRLWKDNRGINIGDIVGFVVSDTNVEFAKAQITSIKDTTFQELTDEDKDGHESFSCEDEMYQTYSTFYNIKVTKETNLKVIKFTLINS